MRDPARIERMIELLRELWHRWPDQRLGQLIVNVIRPGEPCPRVFYAEDDDTEAKLNADLGPRVEKLDGNGVALELTRAEALVLFELVSRFTNTDRLSIEHSAEQRVLWDLCAMLEKWLTPEAVDPVWPELIARARNEVHPEG